MGPLISDLELKKRLARHGARVVTNLGRKSVTHVILGPNGLAAGKIQKEMLARKAGVKYVTVDWYKFKCMTDADGEGRWIVYERVRE
jgi:twin BRCT domain